MQASDQVYNFSHMQVNIGHVDSKHPTACILLGDEEILNPEKSAKQSSEMTTDDKLKEIVSKLKCLLGKLPQDAPADGQDESLVKLKEGCQRFISEIESFGSLTKCEGLVSEKEAHPASREVKNKKIMKKCARYMSALANSKSFKPMSQIEAEKELTKNWVVENCDLTVRFLKNHKNDQILDILYFINGKLLDISKLPQERPLKVDNDKINGRPLREFVLKV